MHACMSACRGTLGQRQKHAIMVKACKESIMHGAAVMQRSSRTEVQSSKGALLLKSYHRVCVFVCVCMCVRVSACAGVIMPACICRVRWRVV